MGFIFPNFRGENDNKYLSCHHHHGLILEKKKSSHGHQRFWSFSTRLGHGKLGYYDHCIPFDCLGMCGCFIFKGQSQVYHFHRLLLDFHIS